MGSKSRKSRLGHATEVFCHEQESGFSLVGDKEKLKPVKHRIGSHILCIRKVTLEVVQRLAECLDWRYDLCNQHHQERER